MKLRTFSILGFAVFFCISCSQEKENSGVGHGSFTLSLKPDYNVIPVLRSSDTESSETPSADDFTIRLTTEDGSYSKEWSSLADIPADATFDTGYYTLYAYYGSLENEGFGTPFYHGETQFSIRDGENTPVDVTCSLGHVKISIEYSEAFRKYFAAYETTVHTVGGKEVVFAQDETRSAYVRPGDISLKIALTKPNGVAATYEPAKIIGATAKQHYIITFDVSQSVGAAVVSITFDSNTEVEPITIDVSDEAMSAPAPYFVLDGVTPNGTLELQECEAPESGNVGVMVTARGGLAGCTLTTQSTYLQSLGFPSEVDLTALNAEELVAIENAGLVIKGFGSNKDMIGYIDFTKMLSRLQIAENGDADHIFTVSARDVNGKVSDAPVTFTIHNTPLQLSMSNIDDVILGTTDVNIPLQFSGKDVSQLQIMRLESASTWVPIPYEVLSENGTTYNLQAKLPEGNKSQTLKAVYKGVKESEAKSVNITVPSYRLVANDYDIWSNHATFSVKADDTSYQETIEQYITIYMQNGSEWEQANYTAHAGAYSITGLNAGTTYNLKGSCLADRSDLETSNTLEINTEAALSLPNGEFEEWTTLYSETINKGGRYGKVAGWQQETATVTSSEPNGWSTVNRKTVPTSPQTKNTWYMVPSTLPATGLNGNGVLLRNVAWDNAGGTPPEGHWGFLTESLESLTPPTIQNRSAGKLFLGSYNYDHATATETYNEGIEFTSRPGKLTGYYKYTASGNDANGVVTVVVEYRGNGETVTLASYQAALTPTNVYTAFEVPLTYTDTSHKATHLRVMFSSSNHASYNQAEESSQISTVDNRGAAISVGSELYIDNINLEY